tara:strand:+ start:244 stop:840 length:597 start_codon:yes stop_codon:yes gene_type:complete
MYETNVVNLVNRNSDDQLTKVAFEVIGNQHTGAVIDPSHFPALQRFFDSCIYSLLDRRSGSRVDLEQLEYEIAGHFFVAVDAGHGQQPVKTIDFSMADICVESYDHILEHGVRVDIILRYDDIQVVLPAIAVRQNRLLGHTAFLFIDGGGDEELDSRRQLKIIFRTLKAKADKLRRWRSGYLLSSAACSILFITWIFS